eukprot:gene5981-7926_t
MVLNITQSIVHQSAVTPRERKNHMAHSSAFYQHLARELSGIEEAGLFKQERVLGSAQGAHIHTVDADGQRREAINLC